MQMKKVIYQMLIAVIAMVVTGSCSSAKDTEGDKFVRVVDGHFVRFLEQPFVNFSETRPLTVDERVDYMHKLGFRSVPSIREYVTQ